MKMGKKKENRSLYQILKRKKRCVGRLDEGCKRCLDMVA